MFMTVLHWAIAGNRCIGTRDSPPAKVERVYAAGPPASLLVFAIAPDKLVGWTRAMRDNEAPFFPERYARLPELGRLTGRGNTANVEVVLNAKADLIVDVGSTGATLASLRLAGAGTDAHPVRAFRRPHRVHAGNLARPRTPDGQRARSRTPCRLVRE